MTESPAGMDVEASSPVRRSASRSSRRWFAGVLVALTAVMITVATIAIWARATVYDTDRFMGVVEPALADPGFATGLSSYVSEAALEALDLDTRVAASLDRVDAFLSEALVAAIDPDPIVLERLQAFDRPTLGTLAPSVTAALESRVVGAVDGFVTSEGFQTRLPGLVRQAHAGGVALVTADLEALPNVYVEDGDVRVDLLPVVAEALQEVTADLQPYLPDLTLPAVAADGVGFDREQLRAELQRALGVELPEDLGQLTIMEQGALDEVQQVVRQADRLVWGTALLALLLFVAALAVSPTRRRTLVQLGLGVVAGLVAATLLLRRIEQAVLDRITDPDGLQAVRSLFGVLALDLRTVTVLVAVAALAVGFLAYLAGRPEVTAARGLGTTGGTAPGADGRQLDRWLAHHSDGLRIAGVFVALGALVLLGVDLVALVVVGTLLGLFLWSITAARRRNDATEPSLDPHQAVPDGEDQGLGA